jgi:hypothetical protein
MPTKKNANSQLEAEEEKWQKATLTTHEKSHITEAVHSMTNLPAE